MGGVPEVIVLWLAVDVGFAAADACNSGAGSVKSLCFLEIASFGVVKGGGLELSG